MKTVNERIRWIRQDLGLSQTAFAKKLGMTQTGLSGMEQPGTRVAEKTIRLISSAFNVSFTWLSSGEGKPYLSPAPLGLDQLISERGLGQRELVFLRAFCEMPEQQRTAVLDFVQEVARKLAATQTSQESQKPKPPLDYHAELDRVQNLTAESEEGSGASGSTASNSA